MSLSWVGCARSERSATYAVESGGKGASDGGRARGVAPPATSGAPGTHAEGELTWALACPRPLVGVLQGEPGPAFTRTALAVSAPGVCEMSAAPVGTTLLDFRETSERSRVTLLAEGWTIQSVDPASGVTVTTGLPSVADGLLDNADYTLLFVGPHEPVSMKYRSGMGQVTITLSSP